MKTRKVSEKLEELLRVPTGKKPKLDEPKMSLVEMKRQIVHCGVGGTSWERLYELYKYGSLIPEKSYILEIGSWLGRSALAFGIAAEDKAEKLICVDKWEPNTNLMGLIPDPCGLFKHNVSRFRMQGAKPKLNMIQGKQADKEVVERVMKTIGNLKYGMLYVDGDHSYEGAMNDYKNFIKPLVPLGSIVIVDDYGSGSWCTGVVKAVNKILDYGRFELCDRRDLLAILRRIK